MGVAALVLGIISIVIGFIPVIGAIAFVPAIVGLILGIVDIVKKNKEKQPKGMSIAGTVLSSIAIVFILFWISIFGIAAKEVIDTYGNDIDEALNTTYQETLNSIYAEYEDEI